MTQPSETVLLRQELVSAYARIGELEELVKKSSEEHDAAIQKRDAENMELRLRNAVLESALAEAQKSVTFHDNSHSPPSHNTFSGMARKKARKNPVMITRARDARRDIRASPTTTRAIIKWSTFRNAVISAAV